MSSQNLLSEREKQVAGFLLQGKSNKEIASGLGISIRTVEFHATRIYAKLGVSSRAEAIVKLLEEDLRKTAGKKDAGPEVSLVAVQKDSSLNKGKSTFNLWRIVMRKPFYVLLGLFAILFLIWFSFLNGTKDIGEKPETAQAVLPPAETSPPAALSSPTPSEKEKIYSEILALAEEYERAVQTEISTGKVEIVDDIQSGQHEIRFEGESAERIGLLYNNLAEQVSDLNQRYLTFYLAENRPTPYPTQINQIKTETYQQQLTEDYQAFIEQLLVEGPLVEVYDPGQGIYQKWLVAEAYARSESMFKAMYNLSLAPQIAKVDEEFQISVIREIWRIPDLAL